MIFVACPLQAADYENPEDGDDRHPINPSHRHSLSIAERGLKDKPRPRIAHPRIIAGGGDAAGEQEQGKEGEGAGHTAVLSSHVRSAT